MWRTSISDLLDPEIDAKVRDSFAKQAMMTSLGATLSDVSLGKATVSAVLTDGFKQQQGFAHGGLIFAIADSAAGYAAMTMIPIENEIMTAELKINYLSAGSGTLIAKGRVLKPGRRLVVVAADVWAIDGETRKHIAALQGTMIPVAL